MRHLPGREDAASNGGELQPDISTTDAGEGQVAVLALGGTYDLRGRQGIRKFFRATMPTPDFAHEPPPAAVPAAGRLTTGDRVVLASGRAAEGPLHVGQVGVIQTDDHSRAPYHVRAESGEGTAHWWLCCCYLCCLCCPALCVPALTLS